MQVYDLIGIGVGPSNLGLAALLEKLPDVRALFLEKKKDFSWHKDSTLPNAMLQTTHLKDLVTMVDPTSRFSFLNYLASNRQIYAFINRRISSIYRKEFDLYYDWVARSLDTRPSAASSTTSPTTGKSRSTPAPECTRRARRWRPGAGRPGRS